LGLDKTSDQQGREKQGLEFHVRLDAGRATRFNAGFHAGSREHYRR
jgi:hypothetical protein